MEVKVSSNMKKAIKSIELALGVKYKGKTFDDAKEFISTNLEEAKKVDLREKMKPSQKMVKGIKFCESVLDVKFKGSSMKDASEFLSKYLDKAIAKKGGKK